VGLPHKPMVFKNSHLLKTALNQGGFRLTDQRKAILHLFQELPAGTQLSAKDLYTLLQDTREYISLSAVYRTLDVLVRVGFLQERKTQSGSKTYELKVTYSPIYLVCQQCQYTLEFNDETVIEIGQQQAKRMGFHLLDCQFILHALCSEAWTRRTKGKIPRNWQCRRARQNLQLEPKDREHNNL